MRFEIFNEREGTIFNSTSTDSREEEDLYNKKISGNSKNVNTFATELRQVIMKYEERLTEVQATMSYVREERKIYITVTGIIVDTREKYKYDTTIKVWS
jgi:predicted component of type VI protein secretion system